MLHSKQKVAWKGSPECDLSQIRPTKEWKKTSPRSRTERSLPQHQQQDDSLLSSQTKSFGLVLAAGALDLGNRPHILQLRTRKYGRTPLHLAALNTTNTHLYDVLVSNGANPNIRDKFGIRADTYRENPSVYAERFESEGDNSSSADEEGGNGSGGEEDTGDVWHPGDDDLYFDGPTDEEVEGWLEKGNVEELEKLILAGCGDRLHNKTTDNSQSSEFLTLLPQYQSKIDAIHKAAEEGDIRRVKSLIDRHQLSVARDRKGLTPLHKAVLYGQTDTMKFLIVKFPHTVNTPDRVGRTPLHYAAASQNGSHFVKMLQKAGADAFIEDKLGHTAFYYRSNPEYLNMKQYMDADLVDQLIVGHVSQVSLQDLEEDILDWLQTGNISRLEELVLSGYGDLLLGRSNEVDDVDTLSFLDILPQYEAKMKAIHKAVRSGNLREVKSLTDRIKLALCRDQNGSTPLHNAVLFAQQEIIAYLVRSYPQALNALDHEGRTPMHYAATLDDDAKTYKLLKKAGGITNCMDAKGRTPKHYLQSPGELDLEHLRMDSRDLLKQSIASQVAPSYMESSIRSWLKEGNVGKLEQLVLSGCGDLLLHSTPSHKEARKYIQKLPKIMEKIEEIHKVVKEGNSQRLAQLLDHKRYATARDRKGCTPLHNAVLYGQNEALRFIIQAYPVVINLPDYNKRTALHYAAVNEDGAFQYKILEMAGADPGIRDNEGRTPEYYQRNPTILDLKVIRDRDEGGTSENINKFSVAESRISDGRTDSQMSDDVSAPTPLSTVGDMAIDMDLLVGDDLLMENLSSLIGKGEDEIEDAITHEIFDLGDSVTKDGRYLTEHLGFLLTEALSEIVIQRPANPIIYLSDWLFKHCGGQGPPQPLSN